MPLEEWGDEKKAGAARARAFVFVPFLDKAEVHPESHQKAFKLILKDLIKKKSIGGEPRFLNEDLFDEVWGMIKSEKEGKQSRAVSLSSTFRTSSIQGSVEKTEGGHEIQVFPAAVNARNLKKMAEKLSPFTPNLPVVLFDSKFNRVPIGSLHEVRSMKISDLNAKLGSLKKQRITRLNHEALNDLMDELSESQETPADMRYYILRHVNSARQRHGLAPLELHVDASALAKKHAEHMLAVGSETGTPPELLKEWEEIIDLVEMKHEPDYEVHKEFIRKIILDEENLKKILAAKSHVAADIAIKGNKLALSMRVK